MARKIKLDIEEMQIQEDDSGNTFVYRKDYIFKGTKEEYSLALMYSKKNGRIMVPPIPAVTYENKGPDS